MPGAAAAVSPRRAARSPSTEELFDGFSLCLLPADNVPDVTVASPLLLYLWQNLFFKMTSARHCFAAGPVGQDMDQAVRSACLNDAQPKRQAP